MQQPPRRRQEALIEIIIDRFMGSLFRFPLQGIVLIAAFVGTLSIAAELAFQAVVHPREVALRDRIEELTNSLSEATEVIAEIEGEVNKLEESGQYQNAEPSLAILPGYSCCYCEATTAAN